MSDENEKRLPHGMLSFATTGTIHLFCNKVHVYEDSLFYNAEMFMLRICATNAGSIYCGANTPFAYCLRTNLPNSSCSCCALALSISEEA
ncbi:hypothetical protein D3C74_30350 [compost metagenome]